MCKYSKKIIYFFKQILSGQFSKCANFRISKPEIKPFKFAKIVKLSKHPLLEREELLPANTTKALRVAIKFKFSTKDGQIQ